MDWARPNLLFVGLGIVLFWIGIGWLGARKNRAAKRRFSGDSSMAETTRSVARSIDMSMILQTLGVACCAVAIAGPQIGEKEQTIQSSGDDIYVLLDVSRSMLADDVLPSRLERAKADIASLTNRLQGERIGLIAFAGQAVIKCPLTLDYDNYRSAVADIDTLSAPMGGTAIGDAIRKALEIFSKSRARNRSILLITDGDDQESSPMEAAKAAAELGVQIFSVGLGDATRGARIPSAQNQRVYMEHDGEQVWSKLDGNLLENIARTTGGGFLPAGTRSFDVSQLYQQILDKRHSAHASSADEGELAASETLITKNEQYQYPLFLGVLLWLIGYAFGKRYSRTKHSEKEVASYASQTATAKNRHAVASLICLALLAASFESAFAADQQKQTLSVDESRPNQALFEEAYRAQESGDFSTAISLYTSTSRSSDSQLASRSQYNTGLSYIGKISQLLEASPDTHNAPEPDDALESEVFRFGSIAVESFQNALDLNPDFKDARLNLEKTKRWLHSAQSQLDALRLSSQVSGEDILGIVDQIYEDQTALHQDTRSKSDYRNPSELYELSKRQSKISRQVELFRGRLQRELQAAVDNQTSSQSDNSESPSPVLDHQVYENLQDGVDRIQTAMHGAWQELSQFRPTVALHASERSLREISSLWNRMSSLEDIVHKSLALQEALAGSVEGTTNSSSDRAEWIREQSLNTERAASIASKARHRSTDLASGANASSDAETEASQEQERISMERIVELADLAAKEMELAIGKNLLNGHTAASTHAMQAAKYLKEILDELQSADPEKSQQDTNDDASEESKDSEASPDADSESDPDSRDRSDSPDGSDSQQSENEDSESNSDQSSDGPSGEGESKETDTKDQDNAPNNSNDGTEDQEINQDESQEQNGEPADESEEGAEDAQEKSDGSKPDETEQPQADGQDGKEEQSEFVLSNDRLEELLRKVREREATKRLRDRRLRERAYGRKRVEKDW